MLNIYDRQSVVDHHCPSSVCEYEMQKKNKYKFASARFTCLYSLVINSHIASFFIIIIIIIALLLNVGAVSYLCV